MLTTKMPIHTIAIDPVVKVVSDNISFLKNKFRILRSLRLLNFWTPKLHKTSRKVRFITVLPIRSVKPFLKAVTTL